MLSAKVISTTDTSSLAEQLSHRTRRLRWDELDLNREGVRLSDHQLSAAGVPSPHVGFRWQEGDAEDEKWIPQGIAGVRSASTAEAVKKYLLVSWYNVGSGKGVRVSFVDVTDMDRIRYRHVLVVRPVGGGGLFEPIPVHAGGLAVVGPWLFVADTQDGLRIFDLRSLFECDCIDGASPCGVVLAAHNYRYVLPQRAFVKLCVGGDHGALNFSFVSTDSVSFAEPTLVTGNYHRNDGSKYDNPPASLVWWHVDMHEPTLTSVAGKVVTRIERTQGAAVSPTAIWISQSGSSPRLRRLDATTQKATGEWSWPVGCEALHYAPKSGNLWCLTEHADEGPGRLVFAVRPADLT